MRLVKWHKGAGLNCVWLPRRVIERARIHYFCSRIEHRDCDTTLARCRHRKRFSQRPHAKLKALRAKPLKRGDKLTDSLNVSVFNRVDLDFNHLSYKLLRRTHIDLDLFGVKSPRAQPNLDVCAKLKLCRSLKNYLNAREALK